jgi:hypothetical protein
MIARKYLIRSLLNLSLFFVFQDVYAEQNDVATIEQVEYVVTDSGFNGYTGISSTAIKQEGDANYAEISNLGNNKVDVGQYGTLQESRAFVIGDGNLISVTQVGFNNDSVTLVDGENNKVDLLQSGNGDSSNITIEGSNNVTTVTQSGDNLSFTLNYNGNNAGLTIIQHGM